MSLGNPPSIRGCRNGAPRVENARDALCKARAILSLSLDAVSVQSADDPAHIALFVVDALLSEAANELGGE